MPPMVHWVPHCPAAHTKPLPHEVPSFTLVQPLVDVAGTHCWQGSFES
jgi:hypothetical protein